MNGVSRCATCVVRDTSVCRFFIQPAADGAPRLPEPAYEAAPARRLIYARNEPDQNVYVLCEGWAFRFIPLPNGSRQILRFLLPGDLFSAHMVLNDRLDFSVKSLTAIRYARFRRADLTHCFTESNAALQALAGVCSQESQETDELVVSLGRRNADARVALLLVTLARRLQERATAHDQRYAFPLRQHHIADITGLTPVHVGRVINAFRQSRLVELAGGSLRILDPGRLERLGRI